MKKFTLVILAGLFLAGMLHADSLNVRTVGSYDITDIPALVDVEGPYAYVSYLTTALRVIDVSDPAEPFELGSYDKPNFGEPNGLHVNDSYAYLAYGSNVDSSWMVIIDVTTPSAPTEEGVFEPEMRAHDVFTSGSYSYVSECLSLKILDVSTPSTPTEISVCSLSLPCHAQAVFTSGNYAYVTGSRAIKIVDISDPAKPNEVGSCDTFEYSWDVYVVGDYAYVAAHYDGIKVIDVSDPSGPVEVGCYDTPGGAQGIDVHDTLAYVADNFMGVRVLDVSDPTSPVEVGFYETENIAEDICYSDGYIYVTCASAGLYVFEFEVFPVDVEEEALSPLRIETSLNRLTYEVTGEADLTLYSSDGRKVLETSIVGKGLWEAPVELPVGVYFAEISNETSKVAERLIVIR